MYGKTAYLAWARRFFGQVRYDLALSGIPAAGRDVLDSPPADDTPEAPARFRAAIARYNDVRVEEASAALGTSHGIWLAYAALVAPGDDVLVESPSYEPLWRAAEAAGARVVRFERQAPNFALDPERVVRAMTPRTRVVAVSSLHNPTGIRVADEALRETARACASRGAHLLVDEVYAPFDALTDGAGVFAGSSRKLAPNIVAVGSLTKCYGLGAHRIGWLLGPADVVDRVDDIVTTTCGHLPAAQATIGAHALGRVEALAARTKALVAGRRAQVEAWLSTRPDLGWSAPENGIFGLVTSHRSGELIDVLEAGIHRHGVVVSPGTFFGVPNAFRLSWATLGGADLDTALARLDDVLPRPM